jgi:hypothetical protein
VEIGGQTRIVVDLVAALLTLNPRGRVQPTVSTSLVHERFISNSPIHFVKEDKYEQESQ